MNQLFWRALTATPVLLGGVLLSTNAFANHPRDQISTSSELQIESVGHTHDPLQETGQPQMPITELLPELQAESAAEDPAHFAHPTDHAAQIAAPGISEHDAAAVAPALPVAELTDQSSDSAIHATLDQVAQYGEFEQISPERSFVSDSTLDQVSGYSDLSSDSDPLAQLTSITQLSDVQPTDWAYQALQSLVERYGCIVGYPDGTYRGQRALSRFEFAAGLNACLDQINQLLAASTADLATQEDLATLQRLQEEFAAELAALRGRVDVLEARITELEANQFSTTTKLNGDAFFVVADVFGDQVGGENETVFQYRYRLTFDTSFSGRDLLRARLQAGNVVSFNQPGNEATLAANTNTNGEIRLDDLGYAFPIGDSITGLVVANAVALDRLVFGNTINPFDVGAPRGSVTRFGQRQPIYRFGGLNTGVGLNFQLNPVFSIQVGYGAGESSNPNPGSGLFNGDYNVIGQFTARNLFDRLDLALTYVNTYIGTSSTASGITAGLRTGTGSLASAVDADRPVVANSYGIQANLKISRRFQLGGWAGFSAVRAIELGDADVWNYAVTLAFPDLGGAGNLGGILVGMQPRLTGTAVDLGDALGLRRDPNVGLHLEAFYRIALNDYVDITPGVVWLTAPNHNSDNPDIILGVLRTTFRF